MKSVLLVLLPPGAADREAALRAALEPHRLDEDDLESIRRHHWDYWVHRDDPPSYRAAAHWLEEVENIAGVLTPDGHWHDLQDHGWRLLSGDSPANRAALTRWHDAARELLERWAECEAVEVIVHA